jgi:signal peptidase I
VSPAAAVLSGLLLALAGSVSWIAANLRVAVVTGPSMHPTLCDNDRILIRRVGRGALRRGTLRRGDIVLAAMPARVGVNWIVKRVAALPGDLAAPAGLDVPAGARVPQGMLVLLGDNARASADSRDFGYVPAERLYGVMLRKI